jgi:hypothetical protein
MTPRRSDAQRRDAKRGTRPIGWVIATRFKGSPRWRTLIAVPYESKREADREIKQAHGPGLGREYAAIPVYAPRAVRGTLRSAKKATKKGRK